MTINNRLIFLFASLFMFAGIGLDAMAYHALSDVLEAHQLDVFSIAGKHLLIQSVALLVLSVIKGNKVFDFSLKLVAFGVFAFSASLYTLCFIKIPYLGLVTPIGGLTMMLGWLGIIISVIKK